MGFTFSLKMVGTKILVPASWYQDLSTKILVPGTWYQVLGTKILVPGSWYQDLGTKTLVPRKNGELEGRSLSKIEHGGTGGCRPPHQGVWGAAAAIFLGGPMGPIQPLR